MVQNFLLVSASSWIYDCSTDAARLVPLMVVAMPWSQDFSLVPREKGLWDHSMSLYTHTYLVCAGMCVYGLDHPCTNTFHSPLNLQCWPVSTKQLLTSHTKTADTQDSK